MTYSNLLYLSLTLLLPPPTHPYRIHTSLLTVPYTTQHVLFSRPLHLLLPLHRMFCPQDIPSHASTRALSKCLSGKISMIHIKYHPGALRTNPFVLLYFSLQHILSLFITSSFSSLTLNIM